MQLVQTKLKVKNPRLTNGETLTLSWSGNSSLGDLDTSYTATAYAAGDTGDNRKPLFTITIKRDTAGAADDNKQVITEMPVVIYQYDAAGQQTKTGKELYFPLSYNKGSFVLTLDAMADAALLRACENDEVAATSLYSITRLLNDPRTSTLPCAPSRGRTTAIPTQPAKRKRRTRKTPAGQGRHGGHG